MYFKGKICPCGIVGVEEEQNKAGDATKQIQLSSSDAWRDLVLLALDLGLAGADCCQHLKLI